ncbi:MAG: BTAD domain-containing putative transcriptional regulator [Aestuariivirga sp.]|nr:BTAD domain-containing putative transcriptional regulator [Aestuariivirga sp.]
MAACKLTMLGGFALTSGDGNNIALPTRKDRLLLGYLSLNAGQTLPREKLYGLLWADREEAQARGSLRQSLAALRDAFHSAGLNPLKSDRDSVTLEPTGMEIDALEFARLAADAVSLDQAVLLYRGELLAGIEPPSPEFEHWLKPERQRLEDLAAKTVEQAAAADLPEAAVKRALELGRQLLGRDRLREPVYRALMRILARRRDRAEAMRTYAKCRDALMEELGVAPELETEQLYRDILTDRQAAPVALGSTPEKTGEIAERPSLAVVPFSNISADPALTPLCEGLAEDIITGLGRFRLLFVIDRNSSSAVAQLTTDTAEIGKRLGVSLVVQGSLQRISDRIRITVRLVNAAARTQLWSNTFDCAADDVPGIPEKISKAIITTLHSRVESSLLEQSRRKPALAAYECVLRGIKHLRGYGADDNQKAVELFQRAIDLDPDYALARAYRGFADLVINGYDATPKDILEKSRVMVQEAVNMEPDDARCRWILGNVYFCSGDTKAEEQQYLRALALNPNDANALASYGMVLVQHGHVEEGIDRIREAMRINPYHPEWYWVDLGSVLYMARRYGDAIEALKRKSQPETWVLSRLAASYAQLGRMDDAAQAAAEILRLKPEFTISKLRSASWGPEDLDHFREGMRKAGLPD